MSRKPWEIPISYNNAPAPEDEPGSKGEDEAPTGGVCPRRHVGDGQEVSVHGAVNDTKPLEYRSGDPNAVFGSDDREDD